MSSGDDRNVSRKYEAPEILGKSEHDQDILPFFRRRNAAKVIDDHNGYRARFYPAI